MAARLSSDIPDGQARFSVRNAFTPLRREFGAHARLTDRETVQLNPALPLWVDCRNLSARGDYHSLYFEGLLQLAKWAYQRSEDGVAIGYARRALGADRVCAGELQFLRWIQLTIGN